MSRANITNFYPDNPVIDVTALNNQYSQVATATGLINQENVRFEGIDTRQIATSPILVHSQQISNGYLLTVPATPAAGALYLAKSDPAWPYGGAVSEIPINHDSTGTKTTVIGNGTKFNLNVGIGVPIQVGDVIRIDLDVQAWSIQEQIAGVTDSPAGTLAAASRAQLVNGVGGQTLLFGGNHGSGMGEWCSLIYPKVNITSGVGTDADYVPLSTAFNITGAPNFGNLVGNAAGANPPGGSFFDLQNDFDNALVLPIHHMSPANNTSRKSFMPYYEGHLNTTYADDNFDMPPLREATSIIFFANAAVTLYSIQLFYSGIWRLAASGNNPVLYLEGQPCNPALGGQNFGVSTGVFLEECRWGLQILRRV
jgi:hypothetical protein